jgi:hypothetical protein
MSTTATHRPPVGKRVDQDDRGPGQGEQPQQPEGPQRPEHRQHHHGEVDEVVGDEVGMPPATGRGRVAA